VALFPPFCQIATLAGPNILEVLVFQCFILVVLSFIREPLTWKETLSLCAVTAAGMLTKQQFLVLVPLGVAYLFGKALLRGIPLWKVSTHARAFTAVSLFSGGWWYAWFLYAHGGFMFDRVAMPCSFREACTAAGGTLAGYLKMPSRFPALSFFGDMAHGFILVGNDAALLLGAAVLFALAAALAAAVLRRNGDTRRLEPLLLFALGAAYWLTIKAAGLSAYLHSGIDISVHMGRYYYPLLGGIAAAGLFGLRAWLPRFSRAGALLLAGVFAVVNVLSLGWMLVHYYG
jgi:hypothetical protein